MEVSFSRETAILACRNMQQFYSKLNGLYESSDMSLEANRGRRNVLMSGPMEKFLADAINSNEISKDNLYRSVVSDGKTGETDIVIHRHKAHTQEDDLTIEIECKLTSPHQSSGSITFQTDHDTLVNKGSLDYVYIIAGESFAEFCVLYFKGLTIDDFRSLSPGARGKVQMYKYLGMKKCNILVGSAVDSKQVKIEKLVALNQKKISDRNKQITAWATKLESLNKTQVYERSKVLGQIEKAKEFIKTLLNNQAQAVTIISEEKSRYSFKFETIGTIK